MSQGTVRTALPLVCICVRLLAQTAAPHPGGRGQGAPLDVALAALQGGDFQAAERTLRAELGSYPEDPGVLSLLGVALDNLHRAGEAAGFHRRAMAKAPRSISVLNNYAVHLSLAGNPDDAAKIYGQVLALDPAHYNANLQLARRALAKSDGAGALGYLDRIAPSQRDRTDILLVRLPSLYLAGDTGAGDGLAERLAALAKSDLSLAFAAVEALSTARRYAQAEKFCESALAAYPANFNVLYDLGVVATYAGDYSRAREVLDVALRQQPRNVDVLYALGRAEESLQHYEAATRLLAQAAKLDPRRSDVVELLAVASSELGAVQDAAAAWDRYLQLVPDDEVARRERSYASVLMDQPELGLAGIASYVARHPSDAVGHYELGQAQRNSDPTQALAEFDRAIQLDAAYVPARSARGSLQYQEGKPEAAVADLEFAAAKRPDDAAALDHLGQAYAALNRTPDAVRVLRRAAELAPSDSKTLLHFARALAEAGSLEESQTVMNRFRQLGPNQDNGIPSGFVDYLALSEEQRRANYRARVENAVRLHPEDAAAQVALLKLRIEDGKPDRIAETARSLAGMHPGPAQLAAAGHALLGGGHYELARELLRSAEAALPSVEIELDLALADFRAGDRARALTGMERIPEAARGGDYYLVRAEMLSERGAMQAALDQAFRLAPPGPEFYREAAAFLVDRDLLPEALRFLGQAAGRLPGDRMVKLLEACTLELAGQSAEAERRLTEIQTRWPEWYPGWVAHAIVLRAHRHPEEARRAGETAAALGASPAMLDLDLKSIVKGALFRVVG